MVIINHLDYHISNYSERSAEIFTNVDDIY